VTFAAKSPKLALQRAKRIGRTSEWEHQQDETVMHFEFVGVMELIDMTAYFEDDGWAEVWFEHVERLRPLERRSRHVPPEEELEALRPGPPPGQRLRVGYDWRPRKVAKRSRRRV
jgi:hypothetical protein